MQEQIVKCIRLMKLYFVVKKKNKVELTDNGINSFQEILILTFRSSRYWTEIAAIEKN
jgi:hypothetical protein